MRYIVDEVGDLVNLALIEAIYMVEIDRTAQEAPEGHTHELLAVTPKQESYRLCTGNENSVEAARLQLAAKLEAIGA